MEFWLKLALCCTAGLVGGVDFDNRLPKPLELTNGLCWYGSKVDCCWGWKRVNWGECQPVCESGCKNGKCVGPDKCECQQGYTGKTCNQDVNECGLKPRPCKHRCVNTLGSYKCYCLNGYMMMADNTCRSRTCALANCQYGCEMKKGEVRCLCPSPGLKLGPDQRTCVDVDECATGLAVCPRSRRCQNTFGSYLCTCHPGFTLRYANGRYQCISDRSLCFDTPGSRKCKCKESAHGRGLFCRPLLKVTIQPPRPERVTIFPPFPEIPRVTKGPTKVIKKPTRKPTTTTRKPTTTTTTRKPTTTTTTRKPTTTTTTRKPTTTTTLPTTTEVTTMDTTPTVAVTTDVIAMTTDPPTSTTTVTSTTTELITTAAQTTRPAITTTTVGPTPVRVSKKPTTVPTTTLPVVITTVAVDTTTFNNNIVDTPKPRGDVHIPRKENQNNLFDLDFDIELGLTGDYAKDQASPGSVSCSFDEGVCPWLTDNEGDVHWESRDDPNGGRYLAVGEMRSGHRSVRGARLTIPFGSVTGPLCLSFRSHLVGYQAGTLQVFGKKGRGQSTALWTRTGGHGWRHAHISLQGRGLKSIVIKGEKRKGRRGEVAVDDISLRRGLCSST